MPVLVPIDTPDIPDRARKTPIQYHLNEHLASFQPSREKGAVCLLHQEDISKDFTIVEEPHGETRQAPEFELRTFRKLAVFYYNVFDEEHRARPESDD